MEKNLNNIKANSNENILGKENAKGLPIVGIANYILKLVIECSKRFEKFFKGNYTDKLVDCAIDFKVKIYSAVSNSDYEVKYQEVTQTQKYLIDLCALLDVGNDLKLISENILADLAMNIAQAKENLNKWEIYLKNRMKSKAN